MLEALAFGLERLSAAARRNDVELCLLTFDRPYYSRQLAGADHIRVVDVDTFDADAVRAALDALHPVAGLISNTDTWAPLAETLARERGFANVLSNVACIRDKVWVKNRVVDAGLSRGRAVRGSDWTSIPESDRPAMAVVKDAKGTGSKHVLFAERTGLIGEVVAELTALGVAPEKISVEPYAQGPLYSAETYTTASGTVLFGVNSRMVSELPGFRELDLSYPVGQGGEWESSIAQWASDVLRCIGRGVGPSHIEFVATQDGPELVEVNSRLGGGRIGEGILTVNGVDPFELLLIQATEPRLQEHHMKQASREPVAGGFAQILKYAPRAGVLGEIAGTGQLHLFPGDVEWHPLKDETSVLESADDQRGCYGYVTATGPSPEVALHRVHAAARHIRIEPGARAEGAWT